MVGRILLPVWRRRQVPPACPAMRRNRQRAADNVRRAAAQPAIIRRRTCDGPRRAEAKRPVPQWPACLGALTQESELRKTQRELRRLQVPTKPAPLPPPPLWPICIFQELFMERDAAGGARLAEMEVQKTQARATRPKREGMRRTGLC